MGFNSGFKGLNFGIADWKTKDSALNESPGKTHTNSTFCPQSVFMCFVWISELTAIISLYNIN